MRRKTLRTIALTRWLRCGCDVAGTSTGRQHRPGHFIPYRVTTFSPVPGPLEICQLLPPREGDAAGTSMNTGDPRSRAMCGWAIFSGLCS